MELLLLIALSLLFGWAFTEHYKRLNSELMSQLSLEKSLRESDKESYELERARLAATIRELLNEV